MSTNQIETDKADFEAAFKSTGYQYGEDALEQVYLGWKLFAQFQRGRQENSHAVAYQRFHDVKGWIDTPVEDLPHYREKGQLIRELFTAPQHEGPEASEQLSLYAIERVKRALTKAGWSTDESLEAFAARIECHVLNLCSHVEKKSAPTAPPVSLQSQTVNLKGAV